MRFSTLATAVFAIATGVAADTTLGTTYTITRTVERVVQTDYKTPTPAPAYTQATWAAPSPSSHASGASSYPYGSANGTAQATGAMPTMSNAPVATGGASRLALDGVGLAAVVGLIAMGAV